MPRANMESGAYRDSQGVDRFDQVKLDTNEVARLWVPDQALAWSEYTHTLRVPLFNEDGSPLMGTKLSRGISRPVIETDFLGRPICRGEAETIKKRELDTDRCPVCQMVLRMIESGISEAAEMKPQMRLAVPVVRYNTVKKTEASPLQQPYGGKILVWAMSTWTYTKVDETREQMAELLSTADRSIAKELVKLQHCDIAIHCENGGWQKYDRIWPLRCAWRHPSEAGQAVKAAVQGLWTHEENRPTDDQLRAACGRDAELDWLMRDVEDVEWRWRKAHGSTASGPSSDPTGGGALGGDAASGGSLSASLDDLDADLFDAPPPEAPADPLADHPGGTAEFAPAAQQAAVAALEAPAPSGEDPFAEPAAPAAAAPVATPAAAPAQAPPAARGFDDIFADLDT